MSLARPIPLSNRDAQRNTPTIDMLVFMVRQRDDELSKHDVIRESYLQARIQ